MNDEILELIHEEISAQFNRVANFIENAADMEKQNIVSLLREIADSHLAESVVINLRQKLLNNLKS